MRRSVIGFQWQWAISFMTAMLFPGVLLAQSPAGPWYEVYQPYNEIEDKIDELLQF